MAARRSGGTDACVIPAGWLMSDSTPPSDSASAKTRTRPSTWAARSFVPSSTLIIPPKPDICRLANSCCGCDGEPDVVHVLGPDPLDEPLGDLAAVRVVLAHAEVQRLRPAQREPRVERAGNGSGRVVNELQSRAEVVVTDDRRSRRSCRCGRSGTSSSSGRRCRRPARAAAGSTARRTCCRRRAARCARCAISATAAMSVSRMSGLLGVSTSTSRVSGRHRVGDALRVARVDVCERQPEVLEDLVEQAERAAVDVFARRRRGRRRGTAS